MSIDGGLVADMDRRHVRTACKLAEVQPFQESHAAELARMLGGDVQPYTAEMETARRGCRTMPRHVTPETIAEMARGRGSRTR